RTVTTAKTIAAIVMMLNAWQIHHGNSTPRRDDGRPQNVRDISSRNSRTNVQNPVGTGLSRRRFGAGCGLWKRVTLATYQLEPSAMKPAAPRNARRAWVRSPPWRCSQAAYATTAIVHAATTAPVDFVSASAPAAAPAAHAVRGLPPERYRSAPTTLIAAR